PIADDAATLLWSLEDSSNPAVNSRASGIIACDFFTVETLCCRRCTCRSSWSSAAAASTSWASPQDRSAPRPPRAARYLREARRLEPFGLEPRLGLAGREPIRRLAQPDEASRVGANGVAARSRGHSIARAVCFGFV